MDINIQDLSVTFVTNQKKQTVLKNANLFLPQGKVTAIVGESGSGKSILGSAVAGLLDIRATVTGHILYGGADILSLNEKEMNLIRGQKICWMAQDPVSAMDPLQKVGKFVTEILNYRKKQSSGQILETGLQQLKRFGLDQYTETVYQSYPHALSGGMAQRVLAAAMTVEKPEWLIADEPTKGLDALARKQVYLNLQQLTQEENTGMLLITHDLRLAENLSDYIAVMYAGEILEYARTEEFFSNAVHPYSRGLIEAQPERGMKPIPGEDPEILMTEEGCVFSSRCSDFCDSCRNHQVMKEKDSHFARCWRYG